MLVFISSEIVVRIGKEMGDATRKPLYAYLLREYLRLKAARGVMVRASRLYQDDSLTKIISEVTATTPVTIKAVRRIDF